jgi:hypothetical protein
VEPRRLRVVTALVLVLAGRFAAGSEGSAPPLPWQDPGAVDRLFLQLPFDRPEVLAPGSLELRLPLFYTNHLVLGASPGLEAEIDFESVALSPEVRVGLSPGVELQAALPVYAIYGGVLDHLIDRFERFLHATSAARASRPTGLTRFRLVRPDGTGIAIDAPAGGIGDAWLAVKAAMVDGGPGLPALSLRLAVKVPSGGVGFGSGTVDLGAGGILGWTWNPIALRLEVDVFAPMGALQGVDLAGRVYGTAQFGATWAASRVVALQAQVSAHLSPVWSDVREISYWTFYVLAGATFQAGTGARIRAGIAENILTPTRGADITGLLEASFAF